LLITLERDSLRSVVYWVDGVMRFDVRVLWFTLERDSLRSVADCFEVNYFMYQSLFTIQSSSFIVPACGGFILQVFKYSSIQVFKCSSVQVFIGS
jgi:hypothetical protein